MKQSIRDKLENLVDNLLLELRLDRTSCLPLCNQLKAHKSVSRLTTKAEPPPTRDVNRDSGTASANGGWLRRLVRLLAYLVQVHIHHNRLGSQNECVRLRVRVQSNVAAS